MNNGYTINDLRQAQPMTPEGINQAIENIRKSERVRTLYELLVEALGLDLKSEFRTVISELQSTIKEENDAISYLAEAQRNMEKLNRQEQTPVS